jgi:hypothetical protein
VESLSSTLTTPRLQKGTWKKSADLPLKKIVEGRLQRRQKLDGK